MGGSSVTGAKGKEQLPISSRRNYDVLMSALSISCVHHQINLLMTIQAPKASISCRTHMLTGLARLSKKAHQESPCTHLEGNGGIDVYVAVSMHGIGTSDVPVASDAAAIAPEFYGCDDLPNPPDRPSVVTEIRGLFSALRLPIGRCSCRNFHYQRGRCRILARHGDASWKAA
jgi:hypothetical protein